MLRVHVFNTAWFVMPEKDLFLGGGHARRTLPVLCFVVEHPRGLLVFDAGLSPALVLSAQQFFRGPGDHPTVFQSSTGMNLASQMTKAGLSPQDVAWVAVSHLHDDHTGDLSAFSQARLLMARLESPLPQRAAAALDPGTSRQHLGVPTVLVDHPLDGPLSLRDIAQGRYGIDPIGDRAVFLVPTYGHTAGHQSLLVDLPGGLALLAGDAALVRENYARPVSIPHARYPDAAWRSIVGLHALHKGMRRTLILPSHDPQIMRGSGRDDIVVHTPPSSAAQLT